MKITKLEIKGFKTFPDKTAFEFKPGITAVVGPNGCGKSNVLEAIRWVMGEQRVRSLRGKKMEDVIFNGSERRKPVGMAEVRMVLSNEDGLAPLHMADYDHIMITRRLFRDGESHYEINNVGCRLSDVTDFFLDTGVGRNSYAIIEQGRVDMVVAAKPEDRRVFIEEAAGIGRYKSRKETALKKLDQTQQNLQRIGDLISEVKRQSNALKRQASKAEQYVNLSERLRERDIAFHAHKLKDIQAQYERISADFDVRQVNLGEKQARLSTVQALLEDTRLASLKAERELKELLEARHSIELELASCRNKAEANRAAVLRLKDRQERLNRDGQTFRQRLEEASGRADDLNRERSAVHGDLTAARETLERELAAVRLTEKELATKRSQLDKLKDDSFTVLQETSQQRNLRETLTRKKTDLAHEFDRTARDSKHIRDRMESDEADLGRFASEMMKTEQALRNCSAIRETLVRERATVQQSLASLRKDVAAAEKNVARDRARLESLQEMQRDFRAYDKSVQFLMKQRESGADDALLGPVAEIMDVPPEYQKALTALLGERLGHVVVLSPRDGMKAAKMLKTAGAGRTTFIPLAPRRSDDNLVADAAHGLTRLQDVVGFREGFEHLGNFLLDGSFVVDDLERAVQVWEQNGVHIDLVTRDGEVLNRYGEITAGVPDERGEEVFEKRREIHLLEEQVAEGEKSLEKTRSQLTAAEDRVDGLTKDIEENDRTLNDLKVKEVRVRKDKERLESQMQGSRRRLQVLELEYQRVKKESGGLDDRIKDCEDKLATLTSTKESMEKERNDTQAAVDRLSAIVRDTSRQTEDLRVRVAHLEERNRSLERECKSSQDLTKHLEKQLAGLEEEMRSNESEDSRLSEELLLGEAKEKELMQIHSTQSSSTEVLKTRAAELSAATQAQEEEASTLGKAAKALGESVHGLKVESVRLDQILSDLVEKIIERHHVDLRTVSVPASRPDEAETEQLREKLSSMGEVNLAARAESRQIQERLAFLVDQETDLRKAVESLYATINAINKTSRERFREAFDTVNEKFKEIFPFLFRGGEARLELTNEDDLLETGVEIMARPPGKRIQNMDLLSGGEKALTAVALIFSIFLTKPSPFCLLDEVDAPLDDANLSRFNEMLRTLSDRTQFLVITHNKRSMQEANSLYGITMEEPGVSRTVSVAFATDSPEVRQAAI